MAEQTKNDLLATPHRRTQCWTKLPMHISVTPESTTKRAPKRAPKEGKQVSGERIRLLDGDVENQHGGSEILSPGGRKERELSQWQLTVHPREGVPRDATCTFYSVTYQRFGTKGGHPSSLPPLMRSPSNTSLLTPTFDDETGTMTQHNVVCRIRDKSELIAEFDVDDIATVREELY